MNISHFRWLYCLGFAIILAFANQYNRDFKVIALTLAILGLMFALEDWIDD